MELSVGKLTESYRTPAARSVPDMQQSAEGPAFERSALCFYRG